MRPNPQFIVFTGPMFAGKTTGLLATLEKFQFQGRHIFAFKPKMDDRYSQSEIVSHMGWKFPATCITQGKELIKELMQKVPDGEIPEKSVVAVDEMFMIPGIAEELIWLYKNNITVVVSTIDLGSGFEIFEEVNKILPWATTIKKTVAVCTICKEDAHYTWRKPIEDAKEIVIGGVELYEARCKRCHPKFFEV